MFQVASEIEMDAEQRDKLLGRYQGIIGRLSAEAQRRVGLREPLERRWILDLEQYNGRYDGKTEKNLNEGDNSKLFINLTRPKTDAMAARLMDLLFPTDDKNWGIQPTPVPSLIKDASVAAATTRELKEKAEEARKNLELAQAEQQGAQVDPKQVAQVEALEQTAEAAEKAQKTLQGVLDEATKRSELMAAEIDDQLKASQYHAQMRDLIEQASKLGTGVCKGPVTGDRVRKGWKKRKVTGQDGTVSEEFGLSMSEENSPSMRWVDLWNFFPDMDAARIEDSEGVYERHLMNKKRLRKLARIPSFSKDAIRRLISQKPTSTAPSYLADLRSIRADNQQITGDLYHVWEYSGPLEPEELRDIALANNDTDTLKDIQDVDALTEVNAVIWFCEGEILKFSIYPYDSGECMYSVFCLSKDEASIFGEGIPAIIRDPQKSLNAGWRAMMDNGGLASGPQVVVATDLIEPADGQWKLAPRKLWLNKGGLPKDRAPFGTFDIPMHQAEMANIIAISRTFIDEMSAMPAIAQGEQGTEVTKTAQGMALLMNSANVVFRRIIKNFDDDVTTPNIRRFYDWNMQFSTKEEIKGDYEVDARGSSVLLVREMQAQNLMLIAMHLGAHPTFGPMLKNRELLRHLIKAHMIPASDIVLSDDEIDAVLAKAAAASEAMKEEQSRTELEKERLEFERERLDAEVQIKNMEANVRLQVEKIKRETALITMAEKRNIELDKLEAMLSVKQGDQESKERIFAAEVAMTKDIGPSGGGHL